MGMSFDAASGTDGRWQGFRFPPATEIRPGDNGGGRASRILLASVEEGKDLDRLGDPVNQHVVWMDHRLAGSGQPSGAVDVRMIGQVLRRMDYRGVQPLSGREIPRGDIIENVQEVARRIVRPDERKRQRGLCLSRIACAIAITSACGTLGVSDAIARSTLARNHASYATASSLVANSDSMGVSCATKNTIAIFKKCEREPPLQSSMRLSNTDQSFYSHIFQHAYHIGGVNYTPTLPQGKAY